MKAFNALEHYLARVQRSECSSTPSSPPFPLSPGEHEGYLGQYFNQMLDSKSRQSLDECAIIGPFLYDAIKTAFAAGHQNLAKKYNLLLEEHFPTLAAMQATRRSLDDCFL